MLQIFDVNKKNELYKIGQLIPMLIMLLKFFIWLCSISKGSGINLDEGLVLEDLKKYQIPTFEQSY